LIISAPPSLTGPGYAAAGSFAKPARTLSAASEDSKQRVTFSGKLSSRNGVGNPLLDRFRQTIEVKIRARHRSFHRGRGRPLR
jgi:hypothetical protein